MKIICLNPPYKTKFGRFSRSSRSPAITKSGTIYYPIWLAYAAGVLEEAGHKVKLLDCCAYEYDRKKTYEIVVQFQPKLIVLDTSTPSIYNDIEIAAQLKQVLPNSFIILVGTHVSALQEETLKLNDAIDAVARHEYDYTLKELAKVLSEDELLEKNKYEVLSRIDGLSFRIEGVIINNKGREYLANLNELPYVSKVYKKHLDIKKYFFSAGQYPMVMIMTGRGCPARCFFCVYPQTLHGRTYRYRSAENVVGEFEYIVNELPEVKSIGIEDDTFTFNKARVKQICELLLDKGISKKINWWVNARANTLDLSTMQLMKKAGCRLLIPGFESGSQQILNNIRKGITLENSSQFTKSAKKAKLLIHGCFMVGNPGETEETMTQTLKFAKKLNLDTAQFFPLIVYPGTEAYKWARNSGYLATKNYSAWLTEEGLHNCVINLPELSSCRLVEFCNKARKEYYLRLSYILYKLKQIIFSPAELARTIKSARIFLKYLFGQDNKKLRGHKG